LQRNESITKVTFTQNEEVLTIASWFGSSGGGLPRRPELKGSGRFLFARDFGKSPHLYVEQVEQEPPISRRETTIRKRQSFPACPVKVSKTSLPNPIFSRKVPTDFPRSA